jgi:hypothetical protein
LLLAEFPYVWSIWSSSLRSAADDDKVARSLVKRH